MIILLRTFNDSCLGHPLFRIIQYRHWWDSCLMNLSSSCLFMKIYHNVISSFRRESLRYVIFFSPFLIHGHVQIVTGNLKKWLTTTYSLRIWKEISSSCQTEKNLTLCLFRKNAFQHEILSKKTKSSWESIVFDSKSDLRSNCFQSFHCSRSDHRKILCCPQYRQVTEDKVEFSTDLVRRREVDFWKHTERSMTSTTVASLTERPLIRLT